jgi:hypothetical protein
LADGVVKSAVLGIRVSGVMRNLLMIAAAIAGAGVFMAQMADRMSPTRRLPRV